MAAEFVRRIQSLILGAFVSGWSVLCPGQSAMDRAESPVSSPASGIQQESLPARIAEPGTPARAPILEVKITGNSVSVRLEQAPLRDVLAKFSAQAGIKVSVREDVGPHPLSDRFSALPIGQAIRRLLEGTNFILVYDRKDDDTSVREIFILPADEVPPPRTIPSRRIVNVNPRDVVEALDLASLPESLRAALLAGLDQRDAGQLSEEELAAMRVDALTALVERLESAMGENETTRDLREHIRQLSTR